MIRKITQRYQNVFKAHTLNAFIITILFFCNYIVFSQTVKYITSPSQLTTAYSTTLVPGDIVELADGTYPSSATMKFNSVGSEAMPITFRPATPGGVTFSGGQTLKIGGEWCIVEGFRWKGGVGTSNFIEFRDGTNLGNNSTLKNCVVDGVTVAGGVNPSGGVSVKHNWVILYGINNTVINCSFLNKITSGNFILAEYQYNASPDGGATNTRCDIVGHKILNNYFYNYPKIDDTATNSGDSEAIRIGTSEYQNVQSNAIVQNNYFVQADGENEIITNKSKGNSYINNTFRRCRGSLVLRHGSYTTVNGNYFLGEKVEGTGGIRIVDSYQTIRNNYIQDCINQNAQAQWNNGITFLGGSATNDYDCSVTSGLGNGYQKVVGLNLSNNTIVNTYSPLFYNQAQGSTDPLGNVDNNLIYFAADNPNITNVITGNSMPTDYNNLGTALSYSGNEWKGAPALGATNAGFSENTGITATLNPDGETYSFTGTSVGADMGGYSPATDAMVGYGIGACFINYLGNAISGDCNVVIPETLIVGSLSQFSDVAGSQNVSVTANVSWSAVSNDAWITTVSPNSGTGDATVSVTVTANSGLERNGTVTFTQTSGTGSIVRILNVTQSAPPPPDPREGLTLINDNSINDKVIPFTFCEEEITPPKSNYAVNALDNNPNTWWSGQGVGCEYIFDLGGTYDIQLVDYSGYPGKTYTFQIWVSTTGTNPSDFTNVFPSDPNKQSNSDGSFTPFTLPSVATDTKFVKIIGFGQASSTWNTITDINFYGNVSLSTNTMDINQIKIYPNPVKDIVTLKNIKNNVSMIQIFTIEGRKVMEKSVKSSDKEIILNMAPFANGAYIMNISNGGQFKQSKMIIISH